MVQKQRTRSRVGRKKALKKKAIGGMGVEENLNPRKPEPTSNQSNFKSIIPMNPWSGWFYFETNSCL
jgi:hypothetical protein